ncbi:unnamed protein product [Schistosoma curassoni]|uniref:TFIIIC_sub6 domain-containing protein n=1 Tax=Schistosoma curassoni TaxID=6186 RepID=A0A183KUF9_9TREM|nr:unnamed protein product [Schistosoma curassoni]
MTDIKNEVKDNQRNDPNLSSNIDKEQPDENSNSNINDNSVGLSDSTYAVNINEQSKTPEIPLEIETTLSTSSSVSSSPHQLPTTSLETLSTSVSQLLQKENNSEDKNVTNVTNDLYLRITLIGDITHIFRLAVDRIPSGPKDRDELSDWRHLRTSVSVEVGTQLLFRPVDRGSITSDD